MSADYLTDENFPTNENFLTNEHISYLQKAQTVPSSTLSSLSYSFDGIFLSYTEPNYLNIRCPIMNEQIEKINIPDIKQSQFLFNDLMLYSNKDSVKYFSYQEKQVLRTFPANNPIFIQSKLIDDTFMIINQDCIQFNDLRYQNSLFQLNVKNTIGSLNNECFAIIINHSILKVYKYNNISPIITKYFANNISHIKLTNDNKFIILVSNKSILLLETYTGETIHRFYTESVIDLDVSEDSQFVFFLHKNKKVSIFSILDRKLTHNIVLGQEQKIISVNPSFSQFVTAGPDLTFFSVDKQALEQ